MTKKRGRQCDYNNWFAHLDSLIDEQSWERYVCKLFGSGGIFDDESINSASSDLRMKLAGDDAGIKLTPMQSEIVERSLSNHSMRAEDVSVMDAVIATVYINNYRHVGMPAFKTRTAMILLLFLSNYNYDAITYCVSFLRSVLGDIRHPQSDDCSDSNCDDEDFFCIELLCLALEGHALSQFLETFSICAASGDTVRDYFGWESATDVNSFMEAIGRAASSYNDTIKLIDQLSNDKYA